MRTITAAAIAAIFAAPALAFQPAPTEAPQVPGTEAPADTAEAPKPADESADKTDGNTPS
jgi:hypothetical protein